MKHLFATIAVLSLLGTSSAFAQSNNANRVTDIIRSLAPTTTPQVVAGSAPVRTKVVVVNNVKVTVDLSHSLDFEVFFPFDSAEITPKAAAQLQVLGAALSSRELFDHSFLVAGHTDAKGSAGYNLNLSARRAMAVRAFLLNSFAISPTRLLSVGFGESQLKVPSAPSAAINRRVEVGLILSRGK